MNDGLAHPLAAHLECFDYKGLKGNYLKIFQTIKTTLASRCGIKTHSEIENIQPTLMSANHVSLVT